LAGIKDIAREAGVSISTVSYALNGTKSVGERTRRRVQEVAKQLRYRPDARGRSLGAMRTGVVGVVVPSVSLQITSTFTSMLLWGIDQALRDRKYRLLLVHAEASDNLIFLFDKGQVDGAFFVIPGSDKDQWADQIRAFDLPCVVVNRVFPGLPCVRTDYVRGAYEAASHLIAHGHRRIGFVGERPENATQVDQRKGYLQTLRDQDIEPDGSWIATDSEAALARWVEMPDRPTAAFLAGESLVFSFYQLARRWGIRIPEDIAVVGCGDDRYDAILLPPLTTLAQPYETVGAEAVRLLFEGLERDARAVREVQIPPRLVVRDSCGAHG
jgi:DNA-binding LacI/PurR family transcriptional regulator